jgi:Domain of unknown function (DUF4345)
MLDSSPLRKEASVAGTIVIITVAVFFLGMGLYGLAAPAALVRPFGTVLAEPASRAEVRAVYGGFGVAIAAVLTLAAASTGDMRAGIVLTVAAALAGMAFGRIVSLFLGDRTSFYPNWFYCLVEAVAAGVLALIAV